MRDLRGVSFLSGAICLLSLLGCDGGPAGVGGEQDEVSSVQQKLVSYWTSPRGGWGGSDFSSPAANFKVNTPQLKCGRYVDRTYLRGEQAFAMGPWGGGGGDYKYLSCDPGDWIVGIKGLAGDYVSQLSFICRRSNNSIYYLDTCGWDGSGTQFEDVCSIGTYMVAASGKAGDWLDRISIGCGTSDF